MLLVLKIKIATLDCKVVTTLEASSMDPACNSINAVVDFSDCRVIHRTFLMPKFVQYYKVLADKNGQRPSESTATMWLRHI